MSDPGIELIGYQVHFKDLETGLFLFNHSCRTTLAVRAGMFTDLHNGPIFVDRLAGGNSCPEYCLREKCLFTCPAECECAYVRDVLQIVRTWPKHQRESPP